MLLSVDELKALGKKPRVHGNGFLQLDLNEKGTRRLHIWDTELPRQEVPTPIHDHVFSLRSHVVLGTLIHQELTPVYTGFHGTHMVYTAQQEEGTQNTILVPEEDECTLKVDQHLVLGAGSVYTFPAWHLHQTDHVGLTMTIMEKVNAPDSYGRPRVLVPVGSKPDNKFNREAFDAEFLWPFVEEALELANVA